MKNSPPSAAVTRCKFSAISLIHPPICPNGYGPKAFDLAFQRMQPKARQIHISNCRGGVKRRQNIPRLTGMLSVYAAGVVVFKNPFQPL